MEWKLCCPAKYGGKTAAKEIELEPNKEGKDDDEISSNVPRCCALGEVCGENVRLFGHSHRG